MKFFQNIKVLELASVLAGPSVGQFFAELGAEVIKIENKAQGGDVTRSWKLPSEASDKSVSAYFSSVNWGKTSLLLDLHQEADYQQLCLLVQKTDIVIASYKPQDAEKLRVDYPQLQTLNPKLIYGHITGYGLHDSRVGYDAIIQAESGFVYMNGQPDSLPTKMPVALVDVLAAHQLKEALLLALLERQTSGQGSYLQVSLIDAALSALVNQATNWLNAGHVPERLGSEHPNIVPYGTIFDTADQKMIMLAVGTDRQFEKLCDFLGLASLAQRTEYARNAERVKNKKSLLPLLAEAIAQHPQKQLLEALHHLQVPAGAVHRMPEVCALPAAQEIMLADEVQKIYGFRQLVARADFLPFRPLSAPPSLPLT
jgi:crotonobetainyl-CoA:carnitine CoA-transferase CaiB-like acyl-CoA transferase